mgnify:CR=1 FL=1
MEDNMNNKDITPTKHQAKKNKSVWKKPQLKKLDIRKTSGPPQQEFGDGDTFDATQS